MEANGSQSGSSSTAQHAEQNKKKMASRKRGAKDSKEFLSCKTCDKVYKNRASFLKHTKLHADSQELSLLKNTDGEYHKGTVSNRKKVKDKQDDSGARKKPGIEIALRKKRPVINLNRTVRKRKEKSESESENSSDEAIINENDDIDPDYEEQEEKDSERIPNEVQKFKCKVCSERFSSAEDLGVHSHTHGERPFSCHLCHKSFGRRDHLNTHIKRHSMPNKFKCEICGEDFKRQDHLKYHKINNHEGTIYLNEMKVFNKSKKTKSEKTVLCEVCGKGFVDQHRLKVHRKIHLETKRYQCKFCQKSFSYSSNYNVHMRVHTGKNPYKCVVCGECFRTSSQLKTHTRKHTGEYPFVCEVCGKLCGEKNLLKMHMQSHNDQKLYDCMYCGKSFAHSSTLRSHIRLHTGSKPYECQICGHKFAQLSSLNYHKRTHTGEKPFTCHICGTSYTRKTTLTAHLLRHAGTKIVSCSVCEFTCYTTRQLKKHKAARHGTTPQAVADSGSVEGTSHAKDAETTSHDVKNDLMPVAPSSSSSLPSYLTLNSGNPQAHISTTTATTSDNVNCIIDDINASSNNNRNKILCDPDEISGNTGVEPKLVYYNFEQGYIGSSQVTPLAAGQLLPAVGQLQPAVGQLQLAVGQLQPAASQLQQAVAQLQPAAGQLPNHQQLSHHVIPASYNNNNPLSSRVESNLATSDLQSLPSSSLLPSSYHTGSEHNFNFMSSVADPGIVIANSGNFSLNFSEDLPVPQESNPQSSSSSSSMYLHNHNASRPTDHVSVAYPYNQITSPVSIPIANSNLHAKTSSGSTVAPEKNDGEAQKGNIWLQIGTSSQTILTQSGQEGVERTGLGFQQTGSSTTASDLTNKYYHQPSPCMEDLCGEEGEEAMTEESNVTTNVKNLYQNVAVLPQSATDDFVICNTDNDNDNTLNISADSLVKTSNIATYSWCDNDDMNTSSIVTDSSVNDNNKTDDVTNNSNNSSSCNTTGGTDGVSTSEITTGQIHHALSIMDKGKTEKFSRAMDISKVTATKKNDNHYQPNYFKDEEEIVDDDQITAVEAKSAKARRGKEKKTVKPSKSLRVRLRSPLTRSRSKQQAKEYLKTKKKIPKQNNTCKKILEAGKKSGKFVMKICKEKIEKKKKIKTQTGQQEKNGFACDECGESFARACHLSTHKRNCHVKEKKLHSCQECGANFPTAQRLNKHSKSHSKPRRLTCVYCRQILLSKNVLAEHISAEHDGKHPLSCNVCEFSCIEVSELKHHVKCLHSDIEFKCHICNQNFTRSRFLKDHVSDKHPGAKAFMCQPCNKSFTECSLLVLHNKHRHAGMKQYKCNLCSKVFAAAAKLHNHLRSHTGDKPYTCEYCGKVFAHLSLLKIHAKAHSSEKPFICSKCNQAFTHKATLTAHIRTHTGAKPFECDQCGKGFAQLSSLNYHRKSHDGVKPFTCELCGKSFTRSNTLKTHMLQHAGKKRFSCELCDFKCNRRPALKKHHSKEHSKPVCSSDTTEETVLDTNQRHRVKDISTCDTSSSSPSVTTSSLRPMSQQQQQLQQLQVQQPAVEYHHHHQQQQQQQQQQHTDTSIIYGGTANTSGAVPQYQELQPVSSASMTPFFQLAIPNSPLQQLPLQLPVPQNNHLDQQQQQFDLHLKQAPHNPQASGVIKPLSSIQVPIPEQKDFYSSQIPASFFYSMPQPQQEQLLHAVGAAPSSSPPPPPSAPPQRPQSQPAHTITVLGQTSPGIQPFQISLQALPPYHRPSS